MQKFEQDRTVVGVILGGIRGLWATRLTEDVKGNKVSERIKLIEISDKVPR